MDFSDFQKTRNCLRYLDGELFIDELDSGDYCLVIGSHSYVSTDLESLEYVLWHFCCGENYFGPGLQQCEIMRDEIIDLCARIDPNGVYRDADCIADGRPILGFNCAVSQIAKLVLTQ